jgi:hypothetical protein
MCLVGLLVVACDRHPGKIEMESARNSEIDDARAYLGDLSISEQQRWESLTSSDSLLFNNSGSVMEGGIKEVLRAHSYFTRRGDVFRLLNVEEGVGSRVRVFDVPMTPTDIFLSGDGRRVAYRYFDDRAKMVVRSPEGEHAYPLDGHDVLGGDFVDGAFVLLSRIGEDVVVTRMNDGSLEQVDRVRVSEAELRPGVRCEGISGAGVVHLLPMSKDRALVIRVGRDGRISRGPEIEGRLVQCFAGSDYLVGLDLKAGGQLSVVRFHADGESESIAALPQGVSKVVFDGRGEVVAAYRSGWSSSNGMTPAVWFEGKGGLEPILYHDGQFGPRGSALGVGFYSGQVVLLGQHNVLVYRDGAAFELSSRGLNSNQLVEFRPHAMAFYDIDYRQITVISSN